ncbi:MAG TPA: sodium:proton antiporter [Bryobacteraceae bacterium]|nr:sodium:proton antiporter [Bryobacteraceae bacterium]
MVLGLESGALFLLIAAVVAMLTRKLRLPYTAGLVAAGIGLAFLPFTPTLNLTRDLIFLVLLPPLIFEAAFQLDWKQLRQDLPVVLVLACLGVVLSAAVTTAGMHFLAHWDWRSAMVFGALIAATDPVSVVATFKEAGAHGRLLVLIESESLFNDGTAAVAFTAVLSFSLGQTVTPWAVTQSLVLMIGGGIACGAAVAAFVLLLIGRTEDHLVEITFTTVAAYGSFLLAEHFHLSGVLATLTAGLMLRNLRALGSISGRGQEAVEDFWTYAAFVANSLVFLLIGMREATQKLNFVWLPSIAILLVLLGRAAAVYPCCALFRRTRLSVSMRHQHILFWGGLRGALALALALGLPPEMPMREAIISVSFAIAVFSVFVQGLTMAPALRWAGEISGRQRRQGGTIIEGGRDITGEPRNNMWR